MPCRKPHRNSHHGCIQCKSKKVKCDQEQPRCTRCQKNGQACTYKHLMSSYDPFRNYNNSNTGPASSVILSTADIKPPREDPARLAATVEKSAVSSPSSTILSSDIFSSPIHASLLPGVALPLNTGLSTLDLKTEELLYHYATEVSNIFTSSEVQQDVLSCLHDAVIRHSFEYPYVYHAMLTVSALHLASLSPTLEYQSPTRSPHLITALAHKASALETLRSTVNTITDSTCEPALAASGLLTVCAFSLLHAGVASDIIDLLAQIMTLYRGTVAIFRFGRRDPNVVPNPTIPILRQSVITATASERPWPRAEAAVSKVLAEIFELSETSDSAKQKKNVLIDAGFKLKTALRRAFFFRGLYNVACMWLGMVHPTFSESIRNRDPLSLILLAHWIVTLKYVKHIWWIRGWPGQTVQAVWREVGEQHPDLMQWALEETQNEINDEGPLLVGS
ncbi:hypothetical protein F4677DRAFT_316881 [Hypoxylon crocopeplum]|nr:hypothetical protein F4677DRAFT_316881 [Hypoxylon crocopeplum]